MTEQIKEANILDPIHDTLDQEVFNGMKPKEGFFEYHLDHVREVFRQHGFNPWAFDFYLTGSLCTYQYSPTSDVDISIVCNAEEFEEEDRADLIAIVINSLDGVFFPGTRHQYQHFVQPLGVNIEDLFVLGLRSAYDFQSDKWLIKPSRKRVYDVHREQPDWILSGVQISDKINALIDHGKEEEAKAMYKVVHARRKEDQIAIGDYSEGNIIYKFLDNNGTFERLRNVGQRIAFVQTNSDDIFQSPYFQDFSSYPRPTHIGPNGFPCSCRFGSKHNKEAVRDWYEQNSLHDIQITSSVNKFAATVSEIIELIADTDIKENSKWDKRNPGAREKILEILQVRADDNNKKFLRGWVNLAKKELSSYDTSRHISPDVTEAYRDFWTNNYGRGITEKELLRLESISSFSGVGWSFLKKVNAMFNLKNDYEEYLDRAANEAETDPLMEESYKQQAQRRMEAAATHYISVLDNDEIDPTNIIKEFFQSGKLPPEFFSAALLHSVKQEMRVTIPDDLILNPEELSQMSPEKQIERMNQILKLNASDYFASTLNTLSRISPLIERYNISFNMNSFKKIDDLKLAMDQIQQETKEREEYRQLLEEFKNYEWESPALFTYEEKKGNPYKAQPGRWTVGRILTGDDLEWEGKLMRHCVGSPEQDHYHRFHQDLSRVYSVRDPSGIPWATIETSFDGQTIGEAYGRHDHAIRPHEIYILNKFFEKEFGKNHDWFDKDDDDKSGRWEYLPDPEREDEYEDEEREPYEVETDMDERLGVYWPEPQSVEYANEYLDWARDIQRSGMDPEGDELWDGYVEREDINIDDDGDPYYYRYNGYYVGDPSEGISQIFNLIRQGITYYEDDDDVDDAVANGLGLAIALRAYSREIYHGGSSWKYTKTVSDTIRHFVNKAMFDKSVSPVAKEFLKAVARFTEQGESIDELLDYSPEDIVDMGQPGSYSFEENYNINSFARPSVEDEENEVYPTSRPSQWTAANYQWYLNRLRNPVNQMYGHDVAADFLGRYEMHGHEGRRLKQDPEVLSLMVEAYRDNAFNQEYEDQRRGRQMNLFQVPSEPSDEEYDKWRKHMLENQDVEENSWKQETFWHDSVGYTPRREDN